MTKPDHARALDILAHRGGRPSQPTYAGTDFIIVRDGPITAVYLFFDKLP